MTEAPVRPANTIRSLYHVSSSMLCLVVAEEVLPVWALLPACTTFAGTLWTVEIWRRLAPEINTTVLQRLSLIVHPSERTRVLSGTWYISALVVLAAIGDLELIAVALAVVGLGDPAAGLVGRRWGRLRIAGQRTVEGALAYAMVGALGAALCLQQWHPGSAVWAIALGGAVAGSLAELFSGRIDDNLTAPLAAAAGAAALRWQVL